MPLNFVVPRRTLLGSAVVLAVVIGGLILYIRLPHATITVQPAIQERTISQDITLSGNTAEPDFVRFVLPTRVVEAAATENQTFPRDSAATVEDFARGVVTLHNQQDEEQRLLPKSHLKHEASGIFFLTDTPAVIPPQGEITIAVTAKEKGATGNVAAGKFIVDKLPASVQGVVFAESTAAFSGGVATTEPITEEEVGHAKEAVRTKALERVRAELTSAAGGAGIREELLQTTTEEETVSADVGSHAAEFSVVVRLTARGFVVDENDLLSLTLLALRSSPSADEEFVSYTPESFSLEIVRADHERDEARVKGTLAGSFASKTGPTAFSQDNLVGRSESEVKDYFAQFPAVGEVTVDFFPFWVTTVPARKDATEITIANRP